MTFHPNDLVKSCKKLESGLRLGIEGVHACQLGPFSSPIYWSAQEAGREEITKQKIAEKRRWLFDLLNDDHSVIPCKTCHMVIEKKYKDVHFSRLGHIDLAATTLCNLRCRFCGYTLNNAFKPSPYDALSILHQFQPDDVEWDAAVDFNGGEPTLLPDLPEFISYFNSRRIRIFLYTNGVNFSRTVYDGIANGNIRWVCSSLDAGCPSTFKNLKGADKFTQVMETLTRYAHAGSQSGGYLSVKYIFCDDNCSDDDINGFSYAMLAIRPQKVWLTFDFEPLKNITPMADDFNGYDYSKHINAYVKTYLLMKKHGLCAGHFTENHLATIGKHGKLLLEKTHQAINELETHTREKDSELFLKDFRNKKIKKTSNQVFFSINPIHTHKQDNSIEQPSLIGKRLLLVPACDLSVRLLNDPQIRDLDIIGFVDRDPVLHGKSIQGVPIYSYKEILNLNPDIILVASHEQHRGDILGTIQENFSDHEHIWVFDNSSLKRD